MTILQQGEHNFRTIRKGLVVDDDTTWQSIFTRCLVEAGFSAARASSFNEAQQLLDREFFHVALVDLSLVGEENRDGLKVLRRIYVESNEGGHGILLTAFGTIEEGFEAKSYGAFDAISKRKLSYPALLVAVENAWKKSRAALEEYHVGLNLLSGPGMREEKVIRENNILRAVGGGFDAVDRFAVRLLQGLAPILRLREDRYLSVDQQRRLVSGRYWSKMLGTPFLVLLGQSAAVAKEVAQVQQVSGRAGGGEYSRLLVHLREGDVAGAVFQSSGSVFELFEVRQDPSFRGTPSERRG